MIVIRQTVSSRIGAKIKHHGRDAIVIRPLWWKKAVNLKGKEEWKTALDPWKWWYYEIELIEKVRETESEVRPVAPVGSRIRISESIKTACEAEIHARERETS